MSKQVLKQSEVVDIVLSATTDFDGTGRFEFQGTQRKEVINIMTEIALDGRMEFKDTPQNQEKLKDLAKLKTYMASVLDSRVKKNIYYLDEPYKPKFTRESSEVRETKKLLAKLQEQGDEDGVLMCEETLATIAENKATKTEKPIDVSKLPESLRQFI